MSGVVEMDGVCSPEKPLLTAAAAGDSAGAETVTNKMVAPALRVEELKDEAGAVSSSPPTSDYVSSEDGASDQDLTLANDSQSEPSESKQMSAKAPQGEFQEPDEELSDKIAKQVEFYFSDANIVKDAFLLKHVRRNKMGYVSLKLITSFKKVKSLTKDYRVVACSLKISKKLAVNDEGTKVRRLDPLPDYDETTPSRTVVAMNLPFDDPSIEKVAEIFSKCGQIALIRILRPGKPVPQDVKKYSGKHPEIGTTLCAVVEFETHESAKKACESLSCKDDWRNGQRVVFLAKKKEENKSSSDKKGEEEKDKNEGEGDEKKRKKKAGKRKNSRIDELKDKDSPYTSSGSDGEVSDASMNQTRLRTASESTIAVRAPRCSLSPVPDSKLLSPKSPKNSPKSSPVVSPRSSPRSSPTSRRKYLGRSPLALASEMSPRSSPRASPRHTPQVSPEMSRKRGDSEGTGSSPSSPWVQRRLRAQQQQQQQEAAQTHPVGSSGTSPLFSRHQMNNTMGIIRQPKGPDGSLGFAASAGRAKLS